MKTAEEITAGLAQFTGTEKWYKLSVLHGRLVCTDGVKWLAEAADAFWLIDVIASYQRTCAKDKKLRQMQFWTLTVKKTRAGRTTGLVICERDTNDVAIRQRIKFTDFPLPEIKIWVEEGYVGETPCLVAMLPNER